MFNELETTIHCPACGQKYSQGSGTIVNRKGKNALMHVSCEKCQNRALAMIKPDEEGGRVITLGMLTDLDREEAREVLSRKPLSADDLLDIYELVNRK